MMKFIENASQLISIQGKEEFKEKENTNVNLQRMLPSPIYYTCNMDPLQEGSSFDLFLPKVFF
jgi:hypothetical protein